jgi:FixJ family two-component response regulator
LQSGAIRVESFSPNGAALRAHREHRVVDAEGHIPVTDPMADIDPLNLVVVDDDEDVRTALRRLLRSMGHEVRVFASAEEYEASPVAADCLVVDLRLPGLNGFELRDRLRLRGSAIPIVFITGDGGPTPADTTALAGTPSLAKPFEDSELIAAITRALSAKHESAH